MNVGDVRHKLWEILTRKRVEVFGVIRRFPSEIGVDMNILGLEFSSVDNLPLGSTSVVKNRAVMAELVEMGLELRDEVYGLEADICEYLEEGEVEWAERGKRVMRREELKLERLRSVYRHLRANGHFNELEVTVEAKLACVCWLVVLLSEEQEMLSYVMGEAEEDGDGEYLEHLVSCMDRAVAGTECMRRVYSAIKGN